jgi:hypothetical protein
VKEDLADVSETDWNVSHAGMVYHIGDSFSRSDDAANSWGIMTVDLI